MSLKSDFDKALEPLLKIFSELDISYYICGSLASSAFGISRTTQDIDMVSNINMSLVEILFESLKKDYFIDSEMIREAIDTHSSFNLIHLETMLKIDIFIQKDEIYHRTALNRIQKNKLEQNENSIQVFISSPEDIILSKLVWFKAGNEISERQWLDIIGVIKVQQKNLDLEYLTHWANELNVEKLLKKAFSECEL